MEKKKENPSQKKMILAHLRNFGSIEPMTALREYGCYALAQRIKNLRDEGYNIVTEMTSSVSRVTGNPVQFANYKLI